MRPLNDLVVDDLHVEIRRSSRQRTLELIVDRGGDLVIAAPKNVDEAVMEDFVREKRFWLYTKIAEKEARLHETPEKEFVDGEGFPYLGRSYRLLLVDAQDVSLKLVNGRFRLLRSEAARGREHLICWYTEHARTWLRRRFGPWAARMGVTPKSVEVRDLGYRWGSCGESGSVNSHWATTLLPPPIVDYVIVHELAYLLDPHHTPEFWSVVERAMPDYERRKGWLAERGHRQLF